MDNATEFHLQMLMATEQLRPHLEDLEGFKDVLAPEVMEIIQSIWEAQRGNEEMAAERVHRGFDLGDDVRVVVLSRIRAMKAEIERAQGIQIERSGG